jgi:hypothetical protein
VNQKPWVVRLYPERHSALYCRVTVWPTKKAMREYLNERYRSASRSGHFGRRTEGACSITETRTYQKGRPTILDREFAEVNLWRGKLGIEIVTHELFHATMAWGKRVKFPFARLGTTELGQKDHERITYAHGEMCRQFTARGLRPGGVYKAHDLVQKRA